jgi:hypothetical protein
VEEMTPEFTDILWKDVDGFEGLYQVSNTGFVKSLYRRVLCRGGKYRSICERILKPSLLGRGYQYVVLRRDGASMNRLVHRLVAETFIPNVPCKPQVNHKNGVKLDNTVENLEWCTSSENNQHAYDTDLIRIKTGADNHSSKAGKIYSPEGQLISFDSRVELSREFGLDASAVSKVLNGIITNHKGWRKE